MSSKVVDFSTNRKQLTITLPGYSKMSHRTKYNFSITDRDFFTKISEFTGKRFFQYSLKISAKYFEIFPLLQK